MMNNNPDNLLTQAIRYCFLVNAGAMVALLAFLGQVWGSPSPEVDIETTEIVAGFEYFGIGVLLAIFALLALYLDEKIKKLRDVASWVAVILILLSIWAFLHGATVSFEWLAESAVSSGWQPEGWVPEGWVPEGWVPEGHVP